MARLLLRSVLLLVSLCAITFVLLAAVRTVRGGRTADPYERVTLQQATLFTQHHRPYLDEPTAVDPPMPGLAFAVAALLAGDTPRLWHLRAIAFFALVTLGVIVLAVVQLESGSWVLGVAAASLALLGSALLGPPPGEARPVALALVLILLGAAALRYTVGTLGALVAALPVAVAWFVDPQAIWSMAALLVAAAMTDHRRALWFGLGTGFLVAAGYLALWRVLGPWFNFAAWDLVWRGWRPDPESALEFFTGAVLGRFGLCAAALVLSCAMAARPWSGRRGLWAVLALGSLVGGLVSTQRLPGDGTPLLPAVVLLCVTGTLSVQRVARHLSATFDSDERDGEGVVLAGLALQFLALGAMAIGAPWVAPLVARLRLG